MAGFARKEYSAAAVKHAFWFMEFRKEVQLLDSGKTFDEIKELNKAENIFGCPTQARATQIYNTVSARIQTLDNSFFPVFLNGDLPTQKLFALIAAMNYDTLLFDLVYEVVREKMIIGNYELVYTRSEKGKKILAAAREKLKEQGEGRSTMSKRVR